MGVIRITVEGENMDEIVRMIQQAGLVGGGSVPVGESAPTSEPSQDRGGKRPVGRPRKAAAVEESPEAPEVPAAEPVVEEKKPAEKPKKKLSLEDVRGALQEFAKRQDGDPQAGILKVRELIGQFKSVRGEPCQKISEVQDQDYHALVERCAA